jgi:hypothetical protein
MLVSSRRSLRSRGLEPRYLQNLGNAERSAVDAMIASSWVPIDLVLAHYRACDALDLDRTVVEDIGDESGRYVFSFLGNIVARTSSELGTTPWTVFSRLRRLRDRMWHGSDYELVKLGPKEARVAWYGQPCARIPYFRHAWGPFLAAVISPFCSKVHYRLLADRSNDTTLTHRFSWV